MHYTRVNTIFLVLVYLLPHSVYVVWDKVVFVPMSGPTLFLLKKTCSFL